MYKIIVNLTEISNCWLEIEFLENGHIWEFALIYCAPVSSCITSLLDMAFNCNWFIKITRSFGSGFRKQQIAKPNVRLIIIENRSKAEIYIRSDREHFGLCETMTHCFFCYVSYHVNIFYVSGTIMGLTFLDSDTIANFLFLFICRSETPTKLVVGCQ